VDAEEIGADKFDPNFWNHRPTRKYNQILCFYVLNVIDSQVGKIRVIRNMWKLLRTNGKIFFALRNDIDVMGYDKGWEQYGNGWITKKGTYQEEISFEDLQTLTGWAKTTLCVEYVSANIYSAKKW